MLVYRYTGSNRKVSFIVTLIDACEPHVTPGEAVRFSGKANKSYKSPYMLIYRTKQINIK